MISGDGRMNQKEKQKVLIVHKLFCIALLYLQKNLHSNQLESPWIETVEFMRYFYDYLTIKKPDVFPRKVCNNVYIPVNRKLISD
jgi:hypothetical protein